ncbi:MAG: hypothetical protein FWB97_07670 [Oscillospiraceae bacterium]|nr:hypothetical protein [Oscillospiraceae bacterium]
MRGKIRESLAFLLTLTMLALGGGLAVVFEFDSGCNIAVPMDFLPDQPFEG